MADECRVHDSARLTTVVRVIDADTLELEGGQRVRLIGIDAPELGYRGARDEPFAREGKKALQQKLKAVGNKVWVQAGEERLDRYNRLLADLFFPDKTSVQGWLLAQGWAMQVFIPPNTLYSDCLKSKERLAQQSQSGIWSLAEYSPGILSTQVPKDIKGAVVVMGRVHRVGSSRANLWLNLDGGVAIQIPKRVLKEFDTSLKERLNAVQGRKVRVRGWIIKDNSPHHQWRIRVQDSRALEVL